jgi:ABC-type branched-subunit amino acid transport system substrate-binding protein
MAVEDAGGKVLGKPVDIVVADHQSEPDVGATIARQWFDADKVDLAIDSTIRRSRSRSSKLQPIHREADLYGFMAPQPCR